MRKIFFILIPAIFFASTLWAQFEKVKDSVVQLYGVVMTADSLQGIPAVSIVIKGQNRGTVTNTMGVFSIVALKGDMVEFSHVSYKTKLITIPRDLELNQYNMVQLMVEDTVYLPATVIRPRPTPQQFERDFLNAKVDDDAYQIARKNLSEEKLRFLRKNMPSDGREVANYQFRKIANEAVHYGQSPPINLFNPAAWAEFIKAWKRGDFRRK